MPTSAAMQLLLRVLLALLRDAPTAMSSIQWERFVRVLFPLVVQARGDSVAMAAELLAREAELHDGDVLTPRDPFYDLDALDSALTRTVREPLDRGEDRAIVEAAAQAAVERHVQQAGRDATRIAVEASDGDRSPVGWARRLTGAENCGFCVMMASRGAVYKTIGSAGRDQNARFKGAGQFKFHDGCDCEVVPVYDVNDWPGLDGFIEANRRYRAALDHVDGRGDNVLKALRRDLYAEPFDLPAKAA